MKRKFISVLCSFALACVIGASFVGCKDYDDDINDLQKQINQVASDLAALKASIGKYIQSVTYDAKTGLLTVTGGDGSSASATIAQNLPTYTLSADGTKVSLLKDGSVVSTATITIPATEEFDPTKFTVKNNVVYYNGVKTAIVLPEMPEIPSPGSIVEIKDKDGNVLGYTITVGESDPVDFYVQDATPLKSIVFKPVSYMAGIEAAPVEVVIYNPLKQTVKDAPATVTGEVWQKILNGAKPKEITMNPISYVEYHLNPSTVSMKQIKDIKVLTDDKDYVMPNAAGKFEIKVIKEKCEVKDGVLKIAFTAKNINTGIISKTTVAGIVSVFATQLTTQFVDKNGKVESKVITSDYAATYAEDLYPFAITHTATDKDHIINSTTTYEGRTLYGSEVHPTDPAYKHEAAIAINNDPEFKLNYKNDQIDVTKLVKVVFTKGAPGTASSSAGYNIINVDDLAKYDLELRFSLSNYIGDASNNTEQNDFATLSSEGILKAKLYDATATPFAAVGRQPIVRYEISDMVNHEVVLVGWIKFIIVDEVKADFKFDAGKYTCAGLEYTVTVKDMNVDVYNKLSMNPATFHSAFTFAAGTDPSYIGTLTQVTPAVYDTETAIIKWVITLDELKAAKAANKKLIHKAVYTNNTNKAQVVTINFSADYPTEPAVTLTPTTKIAEYWYGKDVTPVSKRDSIRLNVAVPKSNTDANPANCTFESDLNAVFVGNKPAFGYGSQNSDDFRNLTPEYVFDSENINQSVKGNSGRVYTFSVTPDGKELRVKGVYGSNGKPVAGVLPLPVAKINGSKIEYQDNDYAKDILNVCAHNEEPVFFANIMIQGKSACGTLDVESFKAKFLRPVNMFLADGAHFEDAIDGGDTLKVIDLCAFTDWREYKFAEHLNYYGFYDINDIKLDVDNITTNLNGGTLGKTKLTAVTKLLELKQEEGTAVTIGTDGKPKSGLIVYKNNGANVQDFKLRLPFTVSYKWGTITTYIDVDVKHTVQNGVAGR